MGLLPENSLLPVTSNRNMLAQALKARQQPRTQLTGQGLLDTAAIGLGPVPVIGDALGLAADASRFYNEPQSRTPLNFGLAALGLLPFVPAMSAMKYPIAKRGEWYGDANYEHTGGRMVEMSPDEYIKQVRKLDIDEVSRENIDNLKQHIKEGKTLDPLAIYKSGKEDGRHRAYAAKELGITSVPVIDWR